MRKAILVLLILLLTPVHAGTTPAGSVAINGTASSTVDLITHAGQTISLVSNASVDSPATIVDVDFLFAKTGSTDSFGITQGVQKQGNVWTTTLPVDQATLSVGTWEVRSKIYSSNGNIGFSPASLLTVTASNAPALHLGAHGDDVANGATLERMVFGKDGSFAFSVNLSQQDQLIKTAIIKVGNIEKILPYPYTVLVEDLLEGEKTISFVVIDRLGRSATINQPVFLDYSDPVIQIELDGPAAAGFPLNLHVDLEDAGLTTTTATIHNQTITSSEKGKITFKFENLPFMVGETVTLLVTSQDQSGNAATKAMPITFTKAESSVEWLDFSSQTMLLPNEPVTLNATFQQEEGFAPVPISVNFEGGVGSLIEGIVPSNGNVSLQQTVALTPGRYNVTANVTIDSAFNQTPLALKNITFEVFLGKAVHGTNEYFIRANSQGLPQEALLGSKVFQLALEDQGTRQVYRIVGTDAIWDPEQLITTNLDPEDPAKKDTPAPFVLVMVGLAALVSVVRRR